jgi:hypothetical protein
LSLVKGEVEKKIDDDASNIVKQVEKLLAENDGNFK